MAEPFHHAPALVSVGVGGGVWVGWVNTLCFLIVCYSRRLLA